MNDKDNYLKSAELSTGQSANTPGKMLRPSPEDKPLDKVKERPPRKRSREREQR